MALTDAEKFKIIRFLGYPAKTLVSDSLDYSKIISDRLLNLPAPVESEVRTFLCRLAEIDDSLTAAVNASGIKRIDDIEFFGSGEGNKLSELRSERKRVIKELGQMLSICPVMASSMGNVMV